MGYGPEFCHDRGQFLIKVRYAKPKQFGAKSVTTRSLPAFHAKADFPYFVDCGQSSEVPNDFGRFCLWAMFPFEFSFERGRVEVKKFLEVSAELCVWLASHGARSKILELSSSTLRCSIRGPE